MNHLNNSAENKLQEAELVSSNENELQSKVLVVEDSVIVTKVVSSMLTHLNCQVDIASEGQLAVKLAKENNYDLIFMDIELPDINGYEITKNIRANECSNKLVPIVALTAHVDEVSKINCINMGMNAVVTKPLSSEQAAEILNALIPHRNPSSQINKDIASARREEYAALPLFDFESIIKQFSDEELAREMITMLVKSLPEVRQALMVAYDIKDWDAIQKIAHKLQGESSYCALKRLHQACVDLESAIKTNNHVAYDGLYRWMFQIINATLQTLETSELMKK